MAAEATTHDSHVPEEVVEAVLVPSVPQQLVDFTCDAELAKVSDLSQINEFRQTSELLVNLEQSLVGTSDELVLEPQFERP